MMPILCFAFFFENLIIPVSKSFEMGDKKGKIGLKSSNIGLALTTAFYGLFVLMVDLIRNQHQGKENWPIYLTVYSFFNPPIAIICHLIMSTIAFLQSICFFQMALE